MLNPLRDHAYAAVGADSRGIVHLRECVAAGMSDDKLRWLVASGRWQMPLPRVFATFSGPIPYQAMLVAAVSYAGAGSALSHQTAAHEYGFGRRPGGIHVSVPYAREVDHRRGVMVHRSRTLCRDEIWKGELPYTNPERTVTDLLDGMPSATAALGLIGDAVRTRRTNAVELRAALVAKPCTKWRRPVLMALPDVERGAESALEMLDAAVRRRHALPAGRRQVRRSKDGTEYLDVVVEEWQMHVELDGRIGHDRALEIWRDMRRDNRSEVARLRHLRYGWADMFDRPCEVAIEQALVLRQQGWPGRFRRCKACPPELPEGL